MAAADLGPDAFDDHDCVAISQECIPIVGDFPGAFPMNEPVSPAPEAFDLAIDYTLGRGVRTFFPDDGAGLGGQPPGRA